MVFEKVEFTSDPDFVVIEEGITMVEGETAVNIQSNVKKSIPDLSLINISFSKEQAKDEFHMLLKTGDMPVCELLKNATATQPLIKNIILKVLEYTNAPYQCPLPVVNAPIDHSSGRLTALTQSASLPRANTT